jgi:hypothetical protein
MVHNNFVILEQICHWLKLMHLCTVDGQIKLGQK